MYPNCMVQTQIFEEFERMARRSKEPFMFDDARNYLTAVFDPNTPTHQISLEWLGVNCYVFQRLCLARGDEPAYLALLEKVWYILWERGYRRREDILTRQEHVLKNVSSKILPNAVIKYNDDAYPVYRPVGVTREIITIEEARKARRLAKLDFTFGEYDVPGVPIAHTVCVLLEELDNNGDTIKDPTPADENLNPIKDFRKLPGFPYPRG